MSTISTLAGPVTLAARSKPASAQAGFSIRDSVQLGAEPESLQLIPRPPAQPPACPTVDLQRFREELEQDLSDVRVTYLHVDEISNLNGRVPTQAELTSMANTLQDESGVPFQYIRDGCYARAHMMAEGFRQHGINSAKIFVRGRLAAENEYQQVSWWYHVAPLVWVEDADSGKPVPKVMDPSFQADPLDPDEWIRRFNEGSKIEVDLVEDAQFYPIRFASPRDRDLSARLPDAVRVSQAYAEDLHEIKERMGEEPGDFTQPHWDYPGSGGSYQFGGQQETIYPEGVLVGKSVMDSLPALAPEVSAAWDARPEGWDDRFPAK